MTRLKRPQDAKKFRNNPPQKETNLKLSKEKMQIKHFPYSHGVFGPKPNVGPFKNFNADIGDANSENFSEDFDRAVSQRGNG